MIEFTREEGVVVIKMTGKHPVSGYSFSFRSSFGNEVYATLVEHNLRQHLWDITKEIRRRAYEVGWSDAKSHKRPKRDYFTGSLNTDAL